MFLENNQVFYRSDALQKIVLGLLELSAIKFIWL